MDVSVDMGSNPDKEAVSGIASVVQCINCKQVIISARVDF